GRARENRWTRYQQRSLYRTPSQLPVGEGHLALSRTNQYPSHSLREGIKPSPTDFASAIGSLVHKALENWSYGDAVQVMLEQLDRHIAHWLPVEFQGNRDEILTEAREVLQAFARSDAYAELTEATILGREVPFFMPWRDEGEQVGAGGARFAGPPPALMEGRIDLIYKRDSTVWLADYKTDRVTE